jgi:4-hydroxybenzoyl-CoA thioesterase
MGASPQPWFESEKQIRFHHCDPAGIVFYPQYFVLFHELLEDWFDRGLGLDYAAFVSRERRGLPTAHIDCDFKIPSKIGDTVQMRLSVTRIGTSSITLDVSVHAGDEVRLTAHQVLVLISLENGAVLPIPADLRARIAPYLQAPTGCKSPAKTKRTSQTV